MGRALMAQLLGGDRHGDYVAPVELVERASLQAPGLTTSWDAIQPGPATLARDPPPDAAPAPPGPVRPAHDVRRYSNYGIGYVTLK